jgi:hypothetical protein
MRSMTAAGELLAELRAADLSAVDGAGLAADLVELRGVIDSLEAEWLRRLEVFDRRCGAVSAGATSTGAWVRSACRLSPGVARGRVELARSLPSWPGTGEALAEGAISPAHAQQIVAAAEELAAAAGRPMAVETEPAMVELARRIDPARLRRELAHARHALAPEAAAGAAEVAYRRRRLSVSETFDGMVAVEGMLDPEGGAVLLSALTPLASRSGPGDQRTPRQRRADALVELCRRQLDRGDLPVVGGERPHLNVVVELATLEHRAGTRAGGSSAGVARADGTPPSGPARVRADRITVPGPRAAETAWAGPICGEAARRLACDAALARVITNGASQPLDVGRRTRTIPPAIRTALVVRDGGCAFPGCDRPPGWTDAHHLRHWIDGGSTSIENLVLLCRSHHRTVHEAGWQLARTVDGRWLAQPPRHAGPAPPLAA